jgi:hypothetical protein
MSVAPDTLGIGSNFGKISLPEVCSDPRVNYCLVVFEIMYLDRPTGGDRRRPATAATADVTMKLHLILTSPNSVHSTLLQTTYICHEYNRHAHQTPP